MWLLSYPNVRVQFQSAWGLANIALLDNESRVKINNAGGTKTIFEWYTDMESIVQLEVLAAMANLTLSEDVSEDMVMRYKCIPFFIDLILSNKLKHSQFACIAIGNLSRKEYFRLIIRKSGGLLALVQAILSHDYEKKRHGCRALANMALSASNEIAVVFQTEGLINVIIKMALRHEVETEREVMALLRNLSCYDCLKHLLHASNIMEVINQSQVLL